MNLLGIDLETTSLDVESCFIVEVGMVLWSTDEQQPLLQFGGLVNLPESEVVPQHTTKITGITSDLLDSAGIDWSVWEKQFYFLLAKADYLVAHNRGFEIPILDRYVSTEKFSGYRWIDTMTDLPYPEEIKTRRLDYLCFEHGFFNPFPHRALTDVLSMFKILSKYDIVEVIRYAEAPTVWVRAKVSFDDKHLAKDRRYLWDPANKFWVKGVKRILLDEELNEAGFPTEVLQDYSYKEEMR